MNYLMCLILFLAIPLSVSAVTTPGKLPDVVTKGKKKGRSKPLPNFVKKSQQVNVEGTVKFVSKDSFTKHYVVESTDGKVYTFTTQAGSFDMRNNPRKFLDQEVTMRAQVLVITKYHTGKRPQKTKKKKKKPSKKKKKDDAPKVVEDPKADPNIKDITYTVTKIISLNKVGDKSISKDDANKNKKGSLSTDFVRKRKKSGKGSLDDSKEKREKNRKKKKDEDEKKGK